MAVYKRYKGKRIDRSDPQWEGANWWMEFKLRGHHLHESIPGARTQAQAERAENSIREEIYNGKYDRAAKTKGFSDFVDTVFVPWAKNNKLSWRHDECRPERLKQFFRRRPLREINSMMVRRLKNELLAEKTRRLDGGGERTARKGSTVNRFLQLLSKIFELAFEEGYVDANPVRRVPLESEGEGRERYLTYSEEERLLPVLQGRLAHLRCPVIVAVDTGMRKTTELLSLQAEHVNFSDSAVVFNINGKDVEVLPDHLLVVKSKNKKPRTIPMTARVRSELLQVIQGRTEGPVFSSARTGVNLVEIKKGFKRACELAGIPHGQTTPGGLTFHDLRHTFATRLAERGVGETARMALLGQSSTKMVRRYSQEESLLLPQLAGRREHLLTAFRLALWTGMRRGEILRLRRCDLNLSEKTITREVGGERHDVPAGWLFVEKSKNGKPRSVPMAGKLRAILESLCDDVTRGEFIFESPVEGKAMSDIKTGFTRAVRDAGINNLTFHDLRHTWSTRAEELGVPQAVRRDILGHSPVTMTDSYTHSSPEARERAVELVAGYGEPRANELHVKNAEKPTPWLASRTA